MVKTNRADVESGKVRRLARQVHALLPHIHFEIGAGHSADGRIDSGG